MLRVLSETTMKPSEFKARLKQIEQTGQQPKPVEEPKPVEQPKPLAPQCMFEKVENGGLLAFYCLEDEGHEGPHRFGESL